MSLARCARVLLTSACLLLALPALASASFYEVDTVFDIPSGPGAECGTGEECSLRVAIEKSNSTPLVADTIQFDLAVFQGQSGDTIFPATTLPTIVAPLEINGATCATAAEVNGPCVGIQGPTGESVLSVESDDVSIYGLAIQGGSFGISVINSSDDFILRGSWIGLNLEGGPSGNNNIGVFIDPGSNGATIGGTEVVQRNVFGNNGVGLDVEGADETVVQGNYFGVNPKGNVAAPNGKDIEVTNSTSSGGFAAENTVIGATVDAAAAASTVCDGGCNVISGALGSGLDLNGNGGGQGEEPASGPTTVHGNYVGLNAAGTATIANATFGIGAGSAREVTVGGPALGDANFVSGGTHGIYTENGADFEATGNVVGGSPTGALLTPPSAVGIFEFALGLTPEEAALIAENTVRMTSGVGIEHRFTGAEIIGNTVEGGETGILSRGLAVDGSLIGGNLVQATEGSAIEVRNSGNEILGNEVVAAEEAGIVVDPQATVNVSGNVIGGDTAGSENAIFESGNNAIRIMGIEESFNEVRRNRGSGNGAEFLVIRPYNGPEGDPNGGIQSPAVAMAAKSEASGKAEAGALVRVFRKASTDPGELAGFLGSAVADGSGNWKATYPPQPEGTIVIATQTLNGGSSSLSQTATTPPDPPSGCPAVPSACPPAALPTPTTPVTPPDTTKPKKPKVTIKKAPKAKSTATTAKFVFSANEQSSFKCKLDKKAWAKCKSPKTYKKLKPGKHVFKVKATDAAGNVSKVLTRKFTVVE